MELLKNSICTYHLYDNLKSLADDKIQAKFFNLESNFDQLTIDPNKFDINYDENNVQIEPKQNEPTDPNEPPDPDKIESSYIKQKKRTSKIMEERYLYIKIIHETYMIVLYL
jgi:hypothetical protein